MQSGVIVLGYGNPHGSVRSMWESIRPTSVSVFDYQNPGYKTYGVSTYGTERNRTVSVFDYQNPGYKTYDISTYGTDRNKTVSVSRFDSVRDRDLRVGIGITGNVGLVVPLTNSESSQSTTTLNLDDLLMRIDEIDFDDDEFDLDDLDDLLKRIDELDLDDDDADDPWR